MLSKDSYILIDSLEYLLRITPVTLTFYTESIRKQILAILLVSKLNTSHRVMRTTTIYTEQVLQYFLNKEKSFLHT